jgi:hypothetical protein
MMEKRETNYVECNLKLQQLKVSKNQNDFMKTSFLPKYHRIFQRISALASKKRSNQKSSVRESK